MNRWGIVCPGPSLYRVHKQMIYTRLDILVAVNGAVLLPENFDYWAMMDIEVFSSCAPRDLSFDVSGLTLWIPDRWNDDITEASILYQYFQRYRQETFSSVSNEAFARIMPFGKDIQWRERTMFMAIALAIIKGADEIRLFGADLIGKGYFRAGIENCRTRHTEKRWAEERYWLNRIEEVCAENGVVVIREEAV